MAEDLRSLLHAVKQYGQASATRSAFIFSVSLDEDLTILDCLKVEATPYMPLDQVMGNRIAAIFPPPLVDLMVRAFDSARVQGFAIFQYTLTGKQWSAKIVRRVDDFLVFVQDITQSMEMERRILASDDPAPAVEAVTAEVTSTPSGDDGPRDDDRVGHKRLHAGDVAAPAAASPPAKRSHVSASPAVISSEGAGTATCGACVGPGAVSTPGSSSLSSEAATASTASVGVGAGGGGGGGGGGAPASAAPSHDSEPGSDGRQSAVSMEPEPHYTLLPIATLDASPPASPAAAPIEAAFDAPAGRARDLLTSRRPADTGPAVSWWFAGPIWDPPPDRSATGSSTAAAAAAAAPSSAPAAPVRVPSPPSAPAAAAPAVAGGAGASGAAAAAPVPPTGTAAPSLGSAPAPLRSDELRVLFVDSQPLLHEGDAPMRLDRANECGSIQHALTLLGAASTICVVSEATTSTVRRALRHRPWHAVHISAHGEPDGALLFEDGLGNAVPLSDELGDLFVAAGSRAPMVVLSACYSERAARALLARPGTGVQTVVAVFDSVSAQAASLFFEHFYGALAKGTTVGASFDSAVLAVRTSAIVGDVMFEAERRYLLDEAGRGSVLHTPWSHRFLLLGDRQLVLPAAGTGAVVRTFFPDRSGSETFPPPCVPQFGGRSRDMSTVIAHLLNPDVRGVLITGPVGIGKTELAKAVAHWLMEHGTVKELYWDAASETDRDSLHAPYSDSLKRDPSFSREIEQFRRLASKNVPLLAIVDRWDGITPSHSIEDFWRFLHAAPPHVKWLLTSRRHGPLMPDTFRTVQLGPLSALDARRLLWSTMTNTGFFRNRNMVSRDEIQVLRELVDWLGGFPLATIIAGSQVRLHSLSEVANLFWTDPHALFNSVHELTRQPWGMWPALVGETETLSRLQRLCFMACCIDTEPVLVDEIAFITEQAADEVAVALADLSARSLLRRLDEGRYEVYPVMRQFGRARLVDASSELDGLQALRRFAAFHCARLHASAPGPVGSAPRPSAAPAATAAVPSAPAPSAHTAAPAAGEPATGAAAAAAAGPDRTAVPALLQSDALQLQYRQAFATYSRVSLAVAEVALQMRGAGAAQASQLAFVLAESFMLSSAVGPFEAETAVVCERLMALARQHNDHLALCRVIATAVTAHLRRRNYTTAARFMSAGTEAAQAAQLPQELLKMLLGHTAMALVAGKPEDALRLLASNAGLLQVFSEYPWHLAMLTSFRSMALLMCGQLEASQDEWRTAVELVDRSEVALAAHAPLPLYFPPYSVTLCCRCAHVAGGEHSFAEHVLDGTLSLAAVRAAADLHVAQGVRIMVYIFLAQIAASRGDIAVLPPLLAKFDVESRKYAMVADSTDSIIALAAILLEAGHVSDAVRVGMDAVCAARAMGCSVREGRACLVLGRALHAHGDETQATKLLSTGMQLLSGGDASVVSDDEQLTDAESADESSVLAIAQRAQLAQRVADSQSRAVPPPPSLHATGVRYNGSTRSDSGGGRSKMDMRYLCD